MKVYRISVLFSILIMITAHLTAQNSTPTMPVDPDTKLITYKEVVTVAGTPSELFNRAIEWVNKQYKNPTDATKVRNPASGLIEIIHRIDLTKDDNGIICAAGIVDYSMKLEMKDGRYRYTITNFNLKDVSRQPIESWMNKTSSVADPLWSSYLNQVDVAVKKLIDSLKTSMLPPAVKKPDEW